MIGLKLQIEQKNIKYNRVTVVDKGENSECPPYSFERRLGEYNYTFT